MTTTDTLTEALPVTTDATTDRTLPPTCRC